ncbi:MAG TPA: TonB-dependent receptor [bacterium]|nr:TonB-dependent receptor [bacterium]HQI48436.1 TonB-dependent receptor [bacterium]HQJ65898.1 TonB-dependent receptor [bacterium]
MGFRKFPLLLLLLLITTSAWTQTTGKITGRITDAVKGEPLYGANIILEGTSLGAVSDLNGDFYIINVSPGKYTMLVRMVGYESARVEAQVSTNRTFDVPIRLHETVIQGQEVVVTASKISIKKDQTSSIKNVSSDQISMMPVQEVSQVIELQAGVVGGHFRGGRSNEVSYLIDGMQVDETLYGEGSTIQLEKEVVQDLEVITGTFNAEYGKAMSGIVNMVTKDGADQFHGSVSANLGNYLPKSDGVYIGLKASEVNRIQDYKAQLEGPVWRGKINFLANLRYQNDQGYLNGIRRFDVTNYSNMAESNIAGADITPWDVWINGVRFYSEHTGDSAVVPMSESENYSLFGKLSFNLIKNMRMAATYTLEKSEGQGYRHSYKYNPDAYGKSHNRNAMYSFKINHAISRSAFQELKFSYTDNWNGYYLYKDPFDPRYVSTQYGGSVGGFSAGGQDRSHSEYFTHLMTTKYDLTWQATKHHSLKSGVQYTQQYIKNWPVPTRDVKWDSPLLQARWYDPVKQRMQFYPYEAEYVPNESISMDRYIKQPWDYSLYIQDKMEYESLVMNFGLRYDYFNSNTFYPSNRRNPSNQGLYEDPNMMSHMIKAPAQTQLSPRFGLSYTLGSAAVLHFSYGHFFQMPPMYSLYTNYRFIVPTTDFGTTHGNPLMKAQKTVKYEMGLWQQLMPGLGMDVSVYYSDIYDLQSAVVWTTYNETRYGVYDNKDYGNTKGLELKFDYQSGPLFANLNYTLQYTRGNADNPSSTYSRLAVNIDPVPKLIPMSWDQRHTLNTTIGLNRRNLSVSVTGAFNSGFPYDYTPIPTSRLARQSLLPNNGKKPANVNFDLQGQYDILLQGSAKLRLFAYVRNLFDTRNEMYVYGYTGHAYETIIYPAQYLSFRSNFNTIEDQYQNPAMYSAPREVKLGVGFMF